MESHPVARPPGQQGLSSSPAPARAKARASLPQSEGRLQRKARTGMRATSRSGVSGRTSVPSPTSRPAANQVFHEERCAGAGAPALGSAAAPQPFSRGISAAAVRNVASTFGAYDGRVISQEWASGRQPQRGEGDAPLVGSRNELGREPGHQETRAKIEDCLSQHKSHSAASNQQVNDLPGMRGFQGPACRRILGHSRKLARRRGRGASCEPAPRKSRNHRPGRGNAKPARVAAADPREQPGQPDPLTEDFGAGAGAS